MNSIILIFGILIVAILWFRPFIKKINLPELVFFIILGFLIKSTDLYLHFLTTESLEILEFLAEAGLISLLFRIGLESDVVGLASQLKKSLIIVISNVALSRLLGFFVSWHFWGLSLLASLFVAVALTATSVGVSTASWQNAGLLKSKRGEILLDIAEIDDVLGIVMMAMLFSIAPILHKSSGNVWLAVSGTFAKSVSGFCVFIFMCYLFARFAEKPLFRTHIHKEPLRDRMLFIFGIGLIIASFAGFMGFSIAIGAFFAGLAFSRDPEAVKTDRSFSVLYDLFYPFFFINIGLKMQPAMLLPSLHLGLILIVVAVAGKMIGTFLPVLVQEGKKTAFVLGISMIPRAEIALIVMQKGLTLKNQIVSGELYSAMVLVVIATCILTPLALKPVLHKTE